MSSCRMLIRRQSLTLAVHAWHTPSRRRISRSRLSRKPAMPAYDASLFNPPAPLARVTLRNQDNGNIAADVPMLLDTGADVTLIPQSSISQLGLAIDPNEGYELMGFDGSTSVAQVVRIDLIL